MYLDRNARLTRLQVLSDALDVLRAGQDPEREDELEEALIEVIEATHSIAEWTREDYSPYCRCPQCDAAVRLAQAILKEYEK
jgi:hypothetical protein